MGCDLPSLGVLASDGSFDGADTTFGCGGGGLRVVGQTIIGVALHRRLLGPSIVHLILCHGRTLSAPAVRVMI